MSVGASRSLGQEVSSKAGSFEQIVESWCFLVCPGKLKETSFSASNAGSKVTHHIISYSFDSDRNVNCSGLNDSRKERPHKGLHPNNSKLLRPADP